MADDGNGRRDRAEVEKLRQVVNDALQQLDWAIGFLHGIGKGPEARVLSQNRRYLRRQLLQGQPQAPEQQEQQEQPLPTDATVG
jgi:hypothetical protein